MRRLRHDDDDDKEDRHLYSGELARIRTGWVGSIHVPDSSTRTTRTHRNTDGGRRLWFNRTHQGDRERLREGDIKGSCYYKYVTNITNTITLNVPTNTINTQTFFILLFYDGASIGHWRSECLSANALWMQNTVSDMCL